jgi:hypothetical protein
MDSSSLSSMSFATTPNAKLAPIVVAGEAAYIGKARFAGGVMGGESFSGKEKSKFSTLLFYLW